MSSALPRLVEIWASEAVDRGGRCGTGWIVGDRGVLTAAHVVTDATHIQIRSSGATDSTAWVDARLTWRHRSLDIALLEVTPTEPQEWERPAGASPRLADVGSRSVAAEAVGFPDAAERPDRLRRPDHAVGTLLPGSADRDENRFTALDVVDATVPDEAALWRGFSGAAVRDDHDRLVGVVAQVHPDRGRRRLLVLAIEDAAGDEEFAEAARRLGFDPVVEDRRAPVWRAHLVSASLGPAGRPLRPCDVNDLTIFGVHAVAAEAGPHAPESYRPAPRTASWTRR